MTSAPVPDRDTYISLQELFNLGLSPGMVWRLLGAPHLSQTATRFPKSARNHYYLRDTAAAVTRGRRFELLRISHLLFQLFVKEGKLKEIVQWAQSVPIETRFPDMEWDDLVETAMLDRWRLKGFHIQVQGDSADMRKLWGYTYLKHNCTNYDDICQRVRTWRFSSFAYPVLLHRINQEILDRYPQCLDRVKGLRRSPILLCHACHRSGAGTFNGHYYTAPPDWYYRRSSNGHGINIYCTRECSRPNNNVSRWTRRRLESARRKGEWAG